MLAVDFRRLRQELGLTQAEAARRFGVSRVTIQNWEGGMSPIPPTAESHWLQIKRQQPGYGPVILHYIHHLPLRPSPDAIVGMEEQFDRPVHEKYADVGKALNRVRQLPAGAYTDHHITDGAGVMVLGKNEVAERMRDSAVSQSEPAHYSDHRTPEEVEARRRAIREIVEHASKLPRHNPNFGDDDLYDERGLFK